MGIYIKDMSLCQFANLFQYDSMVEWHLPKDGEVCQLCGRDVIKVPEPHGRLIDADALKERINTTFWSEIGAIIDNAPTIIERNE